MRNIDTFLNELWENYISYTPSAEKISKLFDEKVVNDHIAFRTLDLEQCNIFKQADYLQQFGYKVSGDYHFEQKKLNAIHLENIDEKRWPARSMLSIIQRWKDMGLNPIDVKDAFHSGTDFANNQAIKLYKL